MHSPRTMDDLSRRTFESLGVLMSLIWADAEQHAVALQPVSYEEARLRAGALTAAASRMQNLSSAMEAIAEDSGTKDFKPFA